MLHVAQLSFFLDPQERLADQMLADWPSLTLTAEAAARSGVRVSVVQACREQAHCERNDVQYYFQAPAAAADAGFASLLGRLQPDVLHVHGLTFAGAAQALRRQLPSIPILLQDHADRLPRWWRWPRLRRQLDAADGLAFCAAEQAEPFRRARLIAAHTRVFEIVECSSGFTPGSLAAARACGGLHGDPALLWVGHLDANKDPLTVLAGVSRLVPAFPHLQLWCCFGTAPLAACVQRRIDADARLAGRVHLLGRQPHGRIEELMRAADLFVLGSHREGSGYAVLEALACGLPPVVTDIASFRMLTGRGAVGALYRPGDAQDCARALHEALARRSVAERARTRQHFERQLSPAAFGAQLQAAYAQLCAPPLRMAQARSA